MLAGVAVLLVACGGLEAVPRAELRVTEGSLAPRGEGAEVAGPRLRAEAPGRAGDRAEVVFTYLGPSEAQQPLESGELRRQVALKLRSQDPCNLVYVAWRFAPRPGIAVQLKRNDGLARSADCGAKGYRPVRPTVAAPVAAPAVGERHALRAEIADGIVRVHADGRLVFEGRLPPEAEALRGPPGLRADNARVLVELRAAR
jgi:hypothetical protein